MARVSKPGRPRPEVPSALGRWGGRTKPGDADRPAQFDFDMAGRFDITSVPTLLIFRNGKGSTG